MVTQKIASKFTPHFYEKQAWKNDKLIFGVDEVGRGCLAGPIVTAAIVLNKNIKHKLIKDSKELTPKDRLIAYNWLIQNSTFAVSLLNHRKIDDINIYQATLYAMKRAVNQLIANTKVIPEHILIDAMPVKLDFQDLSVLYFTNGERQSISIAAASIIAKVTRDNLMERMETFIPGYSFERHKGYSTKQHKNALHDLGKSIIHRNSYLKFLNTD